MGNNNISYTINIDGQISDISSKLTRLKSNFDSVVDSSKLPEIGKMFAALERQIDKITARTKDPISSLGEFDRAAAEVDGLRLKMSELEAMFTRIAALGDKEKLKLIPAAELDRIRAMTAALEKFDEKKKSAEKETKAVKDAKAATAKAQATKEAAEAERDLLKTQQQATTSRLQALAKEAAATDDQIKRLKKWQEVQSLIAQGKADKRSTMTLSDGTTTTFSKAKQSVQDIGDSYGIDVENASLVQQTMAALEVSARTCSKEITALTSAQAQQNAQMVKINSTVAQTTATYTALENQQKKIEQAFQSNAVQEVNDAYTELYNSLKVAGVNLQGVSQSFSPQAYQQLHDILIQLDNDALQRVSQGLDKVEVEATQTGEAIKDMGNDVNASRSSVVSLDEAMSNKTAFESRIKQFIGLQGATLVLRRAMRDAFNTVKELDSVMKEMAMVTDLEISDYWKQMPEHTERASALGKTIADVYRAETLYYQQGLDTNKVVAMSNETLKLATIAGLDTADATNKMTAALRGFNMELNETSAKKVSDVYAELAAITAADVGEISNAMTKTASIASSAGMEFETTAAFLSQIIETTRESAETAGTAMKTIVARFQELKKDPAEIGEVDGEIVDANKIEGALRTVGVALRGANGQFRDLDDVFLELSAKWDTLDTNTQRYIATIAAGSRQQSRFIAMMSDYGRTQELVSAANNSVGASQKQYEKSLESLDAKLNALKNAYNSFTTSLFNEKIIKTAVDLLTKIITILDKASNSLKGIGGTIAKLGLIYAITTGLKKLYQKLSQSIQTNFTSLGEKAGEAFGRGMQKTAPQVMPNSQPTQGIPQQGGQQQGQQGQQQGQQSQQMQQPTQKLGFGQQIVEGFKNSPYIRIFSDPIKIKKARSELAATQAVLDSPRMQGLKKHSDKLADIKKQYTQVRTVAGKSAKEIEDEWEKIQSGLKKGRQSQDRIDADNALYDAGIKKPRLGKKSIEGAEEYDKEAQKVAVAQNNLNNALEDSKKKWQELPHAIANTGMALTGLGIGLTGVGTLLRDMGYEEAADGFEKVGSSIASVGSVLASLGQIVPVVAKVIKAAANTSLGIWGLVIGVVLAVAAAIGSVVAAENSPAAKLEEQKKKMEETEAAAEDAKKSLDELTSSIEGLGKTYAEMDELVRGTDEWKEKMKQVNQQVRELIKQYPELVKYVKYTQEGMSLDIESEDVQGVIQAAEMRNLASDLASLYQDFAFQQFQSEQALEEKKYSNQGTGGKHFATKKTDKYLTVTAMQTGEIADSGLLRVYEDLGRNLSEGIRDIEINPELSYEEMNEYIEKRGFSTFQNYRTSISGVAEQGSYYGQLHGSTSEYLNSAIKTLIDSEQLFMDEKGYLTLQEGLDATSDAAILLGKNFEEVIANVNELTGSYTEEKQALEDMTDQLNRAMNSQILMSQDWSEFTESEKNQIFTYGMSLNTGERVTEILGEDIKGTVKDTGWEEYDRHSDGLNKKQMQTLLDKEFEGKGYTATKDGDIFKIFDKTGQIIAEGTESAVLNIMANTKAIEENTTRLQNLPTAVKTFTDELARIDRALIEGGYGDLKSSIGASYTDLQQAFTRLFQQEGGGALTVEDISTLKKLNTNELLGLYLNMPSEVKDALGSFEEFYEFVTNSITTADTTSSDSLEQIKRLGITKNLEGFTSGQLALLKDQLITMVTAAGPEAAQEYTNAFQEILSKVAPEQQGLFMQILGSIDIHNLSDWEKLPEYLEQAGISLPLDALNNFTTAGKNAANAINKVDLSNLTKQANSLKAILDQLTGTNKERTITKEQYDNLIKGTDLEKYFIKTEDGNGWVFRGNAFDLPQNLTNATQDNLESGTKNVVGKYKISEMIKGKEINKNNLEAIFNSLVKEDRELLNALDVEGINEDTKWEWVENNPKQISALIAGLKKIQGDAGVNKDKALAEIRGTSQERSQTYSSDELSDMVLNSMNPERLEMLDQFGKAEAIANAEALYLQAESNGASQKVLDQISDMIDFIQQLEIGSDGKITNTSHLKIVEAQQQIQDLSNVVTGINISGLQDSFNNTFEFIGNSFEELGKTTDKYIQQNIKDTMFGALGFKNLDKATEDALMNYITTMLAGGDNAFTEGFAPLVDSLIANLSGGDIQNFDELIEIDENEHDANMVKLQQQIYDWLYGLGWGYELGNGSFQLRSVQEVVNQAEESGASSKIWKNPFDWLYKHEQELSEYQTRREIAELKYQQVLAASNGSLNKLIAARQDELKTLQDEKEYIMGDGTEENPGALQTARAKRDALIKGNTAYTGLYEYHEDTGAVTATDAATAAFGANVEAGKAFEEFISELKEYAEAVRDMEKRNAEIDVELEEFTKQDRKNYISMQDTIVDALTSTQEKQIEQLENINDSVKEAQDRIIDRIQESIDQERQIRENTEKTEELQDKEARLAVLMRSSSGDTQEILELQKEIEEARLDLSDSQIDQALEAMRESNDRAAEQREEQIRIAQAQLDYARSSGELASQAANLMFNPNTGEFYDTLEAFKNSDLYKSLLEAASGGEKWTEEKEENWARDMWAQYAAAATGYANINAGTVTINSETPPTIPLDLDGDGKPDDAEGEGDKDSGHVPNDSEDKDGDTRTTSTSVTFDLDGFLQKISNHTFKVEVSNIADLANKISKLSSAIDGLKTGGDTYNYDCDVEVNIESTNGEIDREEVVEIVRNEVAGAWNGPTPRMNFSVK